MHARFFSKLYKVELIMVGFNLESFLLISRRPTYLVRMKRENKDGAPQVQVLDVEYINNNDGLNGLSSLPSRGKFKIYYLPFPEEGALQSSEVQTAELPTYMSFWIWYSREAVGYRIDHGDEDALTYYRTSFYRKSEQPEPMARSQA